MSESNGLSRRKVAIWCACILVAFVAAAIHSATDRIHDVHWNDLAAAIDAVQGPGAQGCIPVAQTESKPSLRETVDGWTVISSLTDPTNPNALPYMDILSAQIEQEGAILRFVIEVRGEIPTSLPLPTDGLTYLWFIDADRDGTTGQPHGALGSDFNVRAVVSETFGGGFVDVEGSLPGGGIGEVSIDGSRITMTIGLQQVSSPTEFDWRCDSFEVLNGMPGSGNGGETEIQLAQTLPSPPAPVEVRSLPPLMMLSPAGPTTGQMIAELIDEHGSTLSNDDYHLMFFGPPDTSVASVDDNGLVTVHGVPVEFWQTPYMTLSADGRAAVNSTVVRSTSTSLGVAHRYYETDHIAYYLPEFIEGVDLDGITSFFDVGQASEVAYRLQMALTDGSPFGGGRQFLVLDVSDDPETVPCGLSGNPVRLGWLFGNPIHNSCYIVNDPPNRVPQFFIIFHEVGHNFTWASQGFGQLTNAAPDFSFVYSEGCASLAGMWSAWGIERCPGVVGEHGTAQVSDEFGALRNAFLSDLYTYQTSGANYANIDPNVLDGIFYDLKGRFGVRSWYDFFSLFAPIDDPLPCSVSGVTEQATMVAAAFSASTGQDLRPLFESQYGFPIDDSAWPTLLACAQQRLARRTFDLDTICEAAISLFADSFESGDISAWSATGP